MAATDLLILRADAGPLIGTGHLMRCLSLAQGWRDAGGATRLVTSCRQEGLLRRFEEEGAAVHRLEAAYPDPRDEETIARLLAAHPDAWVVADGYQFGLAYQQRIKQAGGRLMVIDDTVRLPRYEADILLNHNAYAETLRYACPPSTRLLLGAPYVLLRREFLPWRGRAREIPAAARTVLVTMGGGEQEAPVSKVLQALHALRIPDADIVVANGDVARMPELMARADVAVSGAGSTCWELAFLGVPMVVLTLADNQRGIADYLAQAGIAAAAGWHADVPVDRLAALVKQVIEDRAMRANMSRRGRALVDGRGVARVLETIQDASLVLR